MSIIPIRDTKNKMINEAICEKKIITLTFESDKVISIFPHRLIEIEGKLTVIAEEVSERCLVYFPYDEIVNVLFDYNAESSYQLNFGKIEIDDFINCMRVINGSESRLILKIFSDTLDLSSFPDTLFMGNPYVTTNLKGDRIWASSVEKSEALYEWLFSIGHSIEILDPQDIKEEYIEFYNKHSVHAA